jgi:NarL family two-component system response regulator LiaR
MKAPIRIMIVDDQVAVRKGVHAYLDTLPDFAVVAEAESGEDAVRLASEHLPDVALMDLVMPGMGGVEAARQLRAVSPHTQIVVLTCHLQDGYIFAALQAGAISYLLKDIKMDELALALRRAAKGLGTMHPQVAARINEEFQRRSKGGCPRPLN